MKLTRFSGFNCQLKTKTPQNVERSTGPGTIDLILAYMAQPKALREEYLLSLKTLLIAAIAR